MTAYKNSSTLVYTNQANMQMADPFILDDTARSGYYYLYSTRGRLAVYRSKDLFKWEDLGDTLSSKNGLATANAQLTTQICSQRIWAPEVIWDEETQLYYLFFSAQPNMEYPDANDAAGQGVQGEVLNTSMLNMLLATSSSPEGPFELVNFMDNNAVQGGYAHSYNTQRGKTTVTAGTHEMLDSKGYVFAYPQYYSSYCYFDPQEMRYAMNKVEGQGVGLTKPSDQLRNAGYAQGIDASPFVDSDGTKYLYWVVDYQNGMANHIYGIKMKNNSWLTPDWDSVECLTVHGYYTVQDYILSMRKGEAVTSKVPHELSGSKCNEGPVVLKHNGKYYLTYSANGHNNGTYLAAQAVADSPLGPFRKLTPAENGELLSNDGATYSAVCAPGHHNFVTVGDKLYICYHKYTDPTSMSVTSGKHFCIDEVQWVSITDSNGKQMDVLYVNGPTVSAQPKIVSEFSNLAENAEITLKDGKLAESSSLDALNDGLLSVYTTSNEEFNKKYIPETVITETSTFEITFEEEMKISTIMVYNSKDKEQLFTNISEIRLICIENGREVTYKIEDVPFDISENGTSRGGRIISVNRGASSYVSFYEKEVKSIQITVEVPEGATVGISEIRVLGR